ncbi:MAG: sialidase family protein [Planctomycetota bacterium]
MNSPGRRLAGLVLLCAAVSGPAAGADVKRLCSFEKGEVAGWGAKFETESDTAYTTRRFTYYKNVGSGTTETATHGEWALVRTIHDKYNFLRPGNETIYYEKVRHGRVLRTYGWFRKAFGTDWSGHDRLWIDCRAEIPVRLRLELEDAFIPHPVVRRFKLPAGRWVTLEVDLARAARERHLDRSKMAQLTAIVLERFDEKQTFKVWLDNVRLAPADAKADRPVLRDESPMDVALPRRPGPELGPLDISKTTKPSGLVGRIDVGGKPSYDLMKVMERAVGGFGEGGLIVVNGPRVWLSRDAGKTWTGLDGKPGPTRLSRDHRGHHRATATILGTDVYAAYCTSRCAGGGGRTRNHFTRAVREDDRWAMGPEVAIETGARHCTARFSIVRTSSGRLWCAWVHTGRQGGELRAKFSDDEGETWHDAGLNGRVAAGRCQGVGLSPFNGGAICIWRWNQKAVVFSRTRPIETEVKRLGDDQRVIVNAGAKAGVLRYGTFFVVDGDKTTHVLQVLDLADDEATTIVESGKAAAIEPGDRVVGVTWTKPEPISRKMRRASVATTSDGTLFVLLMGRRVPAEVRRYDGETWADDTPPDLGRSAPDPVLIASGRRVACAWNKRGKIMLILRGEHGKWTKSRPIAEETEPVTILAAPQTAPESFVPVAWATRSRDFIKVVAVPITD